MACSKCILNCVVPLFSSPPLCWLIYSVREQSRIPTLSEERKKNMQQHMYCVCTTEASFEYSFLMHLICNRFDSLCTYTEFTQFSTEFRLHLRLSVKSFFFNIKMSLFLRQKLFMFLRFCPFFVNYGLDFKSVHQCNEPLHIDEHCNEITSGIKLIHPIYTIAKYNY